MTVIQKASREEMFRVVHAAMFPYDVVHKHMNDAVRFVKAAEALGLIRFSRPEPHAAGQAAGE